MKRKSTMILGAMLLAGALALPVNAATEEDVIGTWYLNSMEIGETTLNPNVFGIDMEIEVEESGECVVKVAGEEDTEGTWVLDGDKLIMGTATFEYADEKLSAVYDDTLMIYGKEKEEVSKYELPDVVKAPKPEDLEGVWKATVIKLQGIEMLISTMDMEMTLTVKDSKVDMEYVNGTETQNAEMEIAINGDTITLSDIPGGDVPDNELSSMDMHLHEGGIISYQEGTSDDDLMIIFAKEQ